MPSYQGPCQKCGAWVDRYVRPGKPFICAACSLDVMLDVARQQAERTGPEYERARQAGLEAAEKILSQQGPTYDKWRHNLLRGLERHNVYPPVTSDTVEGQPAEEKLS